MATRNGPPGANDILQTILGHVRRTSARDLWARSTTETYTPMEHDAMVKAGWTPDMDRGKTLPMQMSVRSALFAALSEDEQSEWERKSKAEKAGKETLSP